MTIKKIDAQERKKLAACYETALEAGDFDVVQSVLALAEQDSQLEDLIVEVNENRLISLQTSLAQTSAGKLDTPHSTAHQNKRDNRTFWTVAAASLVTVLLGVILVVSRMPELRTLVIAPPAPVLSFTQHDLITSENIDQLQPFAHLGNGTIHQIHMMPDGEHLLIAASTGLFLHDAQDLSAEPQQIYAGTVGYYSDIDVNGNLYGTSENIIGQQVYDITISRWNGTTGERTEIIQMNNLQPYTLNGLEVKPDGTQVLLSLCGEIRVFSNFGATCSQRIFAWYNTATGEQIYEVSFPIGNTWSSYAMSDNWSFFAYAVDGDDSDTQKLPEIKLMNMASREIRTVVSSGEAQPTQSTDVRGVGVFELSHDGRFLLVTGSFTYHNTTLIYDTAELWNSTTPVNPRNTTNTAVEYHISSSVGGFNAPIFTPDSSRVLSIWNNQLFLYQLGDSEQLISAWETAYLNAEYTMPLAGRTIFSPDGSTLFIQYQGNIVMAYDTETLNKIDEMVYYQNDAGEDFHFTDDGSQLIIRAGAYRNGIPDIWTINTDPPIHEPFLVGNVPAVLQQFAVSPDGITIAYQLYRTWSEEHSLWVQHQEDSSTTLQLPIYSQLIDLQFLKDGTLVGFSLNPSILRWSPEALASEDSAHRPDEMRLVGASPNIVDFTDAKRMITDTNGRWVAAAICQTATACERNTFKIWDLESERTIAIVGDDAFHRFGAMAFSPDSQLFAYAYCAEQFQFLSEGADCTTGEVRFFTLASLNEFQDSRVAQQSVEPLMTLTAFEELPTNIAFHPVQQADGSWLVAITEWNTRTQLWRIQEDGTAEVLQVLDAVRKPVTFDPTGGLMFTTADTAQIEVWGVPLIQTANP